MSLKSYDGGFTVPVVTSLLLAIAAVCLIGWLLFGTAFGADNVAPCLTKEQARAKWPKDWIFWHGLNHCWDNVRGRAKTANMPTGEVKIIVAPKPNRARKASRSDAFDANGNAADPSGKPVEIKGPSTYFPDLMPGRGTDDALMRPDPMTWWPVLIDIDNPPQFIPWQRRVSFLTTTTEGSTR
jgi:hypothetical protein